MTTTDEFFELCTKTRNELANHLMILGRIEYEYLKNKSHAKESYRRLLLDSTREFYLKVSAIGNLL